MNGVILLVILSVFVVGMLYLMNEERKSSNKSFERLNRIMDEYHRRNVEKK